jgi:hypothetical protein
LSKQTFTLEQVIQILQNSGIDTTCPACADVAFTGSTTAKHSCPVPIVKDTVSAYPYKLGKISEERIQHLLKCVSPDNMASIAVPREELDELLNTYRNFYQVLEVEPNDDTEPLFTLRGQDWVAPEIVREWAFRSLKLGSPLDKVDGARRIADAMENWQVANDKRKVAD